MTLNVLDGFSVMFLFRFRNECPDGKLTKHHLKTLFEKVFPDGRWLPTIWNHLDFVPGNASKITSQIFRIFDSDGNDFLDFKEFLMAIDVANRTTGAFLNFQRIFNPSCQMSVFCHFATTSVIFCLETDEEKLRWTFRLYDMDNNGVIDMEEMIGIIETLDSIEGVKPGARTKRWQIKCLKGWTPKILKGWSAKMFEGVIR